MNIGERIKYYRKKSRITQQKLAELIGVQASAISKYEKNIVIPSIEQTNKIAEALGINVIALLDDDNAATYSQIISHSKEMFADYMAHPEKYKTDITEDGKQVFYIDTDRTDIVLKYDMLNKTGKQKALDYITDLTEISKYTKSDEE